MLAKINAFALGGNRIPVVQSMTSHFIDTFIPIPTAKNITSFLSNKRNKTIRAYRWRGGKSILDLLGGKWR
jgi:hypothetical protein